MLQDIVSPFESTWGKEKLLPNVVTIYKLLLVNPATTATAKHSFFTETTNKVLEAFMVPHTFNSEIDLKNIFNDFAAQNERRKRMFGPF